MSEKPKHDDALEARRQLADKVEELQRLTRDHEVTLAMLREFVDSGDIGLYVSDFETGDILLVNRYYADNFGVAADDCVGKKCWVVGGPGGDTFCPYCPRDRLLDEKGEPTAPYRWENQNPLTGTWLRCSNQALRWVDGRMVHMVTYQDVTEEHNMREELARLAYNDRLLGLPNRLRLSLDMEPFLRGEAEEESCLVCFDITALRRVNEAYGHTTGDMLLRTVADWVAAQRFGEKALYRIEGDGFALLFIHPAPGGALAAAERLHRRFGEAWLVALQGRHIPVLCRASVSVVALCPGDTDELVFSRIERTLEASVEAGRVVVLDEAMDADMRERIAMEMALQHSVANGMTGFSLHYQPIVDVAQGGWRGLEALCRWTGPDGRAVPPSAFIPRAEQLGLIGTLGMWVLRTAVAQAKSWGLDAVENFFLSVNLSAVQVMETGLVEAVAGLLQAQAFPGHKLFLEITESTEFAFNSVSHTVIAELRRHGVRFSLDDFGTGYSSFNNLKNLPVAVLKTERTFIEGAEQDTYRQYLFYSMSELAHAAGMKLVAEGVETEAELRVALTNGADFLQGYYFSRPLEAEALAQHLEKFRQVDTRFFSHSAPVPQAGQPFSGSEAFLSSPRLFKLLTRCTRMLLAAREPGSCVEAVLELVGKHFGATRHTLYVRTGEALYTCLYEWHLPRLPALIPAHRQVEPFAMSASWLPLLQRDGMILASDIATLPGDICGLLAPLNVRAAAVMPLLDGQALLGYTALFDNRYRNWLPEEVAALQNLAVVLASALKQARLEQRLQELEQRA